MITTELEYLASNSPSVVMRCVNDCSHYARPRLLDIGKKKMWMNTCRRLLKASVEHVLFNDPLIGVLLHNEYDNERNATLCAALLKEIVGNPWREYTVCERSRRILLLADHHYRLRPKPIKLVNTTTNYIDNVSSSIVSAIIAEDNRTECVLDTTALAVLADSLEDSGFTEQDILQHLRGKERCFRHNNRGPHCPECGGYGWIDKRAPCVPGCWVIELLRSKEG